MGIDCSNGPGKFTSSAEHLDYLERMLGEATSLMPLVALKRCSQELRDWISAQTKNDPSLIQAEINQRQAELERMSNDSWRIKKDINKLHRDLERIEAVNRRKK